MAQKLVTVTMTLPDGRRKYYRGKTKKEAEAKRDRDAALLDHGVDITTNPTFEEFGELWFDLNKNNSSLHVRSKETTRGILERYVYPAIGRKAVRELRPTDIMNMMKDLSEYSQSTQRKVLQATRAICSFAVDNDIITKSPVLTSIKASGAATEEIKPLTDEQCQCLLAAVKDTRAYLFVELLLYTGLRKGEALGLMWKDIDFRSSTLSVERSVIYPINNKAGEINPELKTSAARRVIPIVPELKKDLETAKGKSKSLYVFSMKDGSFLSESSFRRMWDLINYRSTKTEGSRKILDRTVDFDVHPHLLRHTCVTRWIESGLTAKEAQYLAGHASPDVTMRIYAHYRREQQLAETAAKMAAYSSRIAIQA